MQDTYHEMNLAHWPSEQLDNLGGQCYSGPIQEDLRGRVQLPTGGDGKVTGHRGQATGNIEINVFNGTYNL